MTTMTDSRAVEVLAEMRNDGGTVDEADYTAAIDHAIARLREPAGMGANELAGVRARLKSGDYDGADVMRAWIAIDKLLAKQPASDEGFTAADMMDARQEGRKEAKQPAAVTQPAGGDVSNGSQQPAAVDEAMVERALAEWKRLEGHQTDAVRMSAALQEALAAQPGGSDNDH